MSDYVQRNGRAAKAQKNCSSNERSQIILVPLPAITACQMHHSSRNVEGTRRRLAENWGKLVSTPQLPSVSVNSMRRHRKERIGLARSFARHDEDFGVMGEE